VNELSTKIALVVDNGNYPHVATKLAESFGGVFYWVPWITNAYPSSTLRNIGCGLPGVTRTYSWLSVLKEVDLVVCPDVYSFDVVEHCRELGKPVWGAGRAEMLELERWKTKLLLRELDMPVVPAILIEGVDDLREYLEDPANTDRYIKTSITRGDFETFHHVNWHLTEDWLKDLSHRLGPRDQHIEFVVEEPIRGIEIGYDGFNILGQFPHTASYGYEIKDAGYIGRVARQDELPEALRSTNSAIAGDLGRLGCRGFYSSEVRIGEDRTAYLIDPTMRCGSPPSESYIELFTNWPEVIWAGAHGELVDLEPVAKFSAQIVLKSDWLVREKFLPVTFPAELAPWIKLHDACNIDGQWYVVPVPTFLPGTIYPEFGAVVGLGDTVEEAIEAAKGRVEQIECLELRWSEDVFDAAMKAIDEGRELGVEF